LQPDRRTLKEFSGQKQFSKFVLPQPGSAMLDVVRFAGKIQFRPAGTRDCAGEFFYRPA
jgi:hypothetical protein